MKVNVFADISNLYYTSIKKWGRKLCYKRVSRYVSDYGTIGVKKAYGSQIGTGAKGFIAALELDGWEAIFKEPKTYSDGHGGIKRKSDWDVPMALDMVSAAERERCTIILLSADGDMTAAVAACQERGARVVVMGFGLSGELCGVADSAIEIPPSLLEDE